MSHALSVVETDRGRRLVVSRTVDAPAATAWRVFTAVAFWPEWGPPVTAVDYPGETISPDTSGRVQVFGVHWVPFRIEAVADRCWTWTAWGRTPPADGHRVEALGDGRCRISLELPLWAPWYLPLCLVALRNVTRVAQREHDTAGTEGGVKRG